MTKQEAIALIDQLEFVFDIVRLVDAAMTRRLSTDSNGEFVTEPYHCYTVWNKDSPAITVFLPKFSPVLQ